MTSVISVEGLSKVYRLGQINTGTFANDLTVWWAKMRGKPNPFLKIGARDHGHRIGEDLWALRDVSFTVEQGEVLGIIGPNGAGKSTLLKILSRVTAPTSGKIKIRGRVASLLEVGTGFHPELTGRENTYLNGAVLGMSHQEIDQKFDEIVNFAEVEKFIDTPVKRYSSGMYVRLAFAVAAHLEPEILVVDEVLAVGDAAFQKKCLGKMGDVARGGRTVLFVSHNMASIQHLCSRVVLLDSGRLSMTGEAEECVAHYLSGAQEGSHISISDWDNRTGTGEARLVGFELADGRGKEANCIPFGGSLVVTFHAEVHTPVVDPCFGFTVLSALGDPILDFRSIQSGLKLGRVQGMIKVQAHIDALTLYPGRYLLTPWISDSTIKRDLDVAWLCGVLHVDPAPGPHGDLRLDPTWGKYWVQSHWRSVEPPQ